MRSILFVCVLCLAVLACSGGAGPSPEAVVEPTQPPSPIVEPTVVPPTPTETGPRQISWEDVRANVGETAKVCGEAVTVATLLDGRTIVNLGETPKNGGVIVVVTDSSMFPEAELKKLYGEEVCVTGEIVLEDDNVGIYVSDPSQIESDLISTAPSGTANQTFHDDFTDSLQMGWEWRNEDPSRWEITPEGWLQIVGEDASLLADGTQSNLLCRDAPDDDFQVTVHLFADPREDFQQATLYLYQNGDNYVAINRGYCSLCETGGGGMFMEYKVAGSWEAFNVKTQEPDVFLRLVSQGQTVTGYYAFELGEWNLMGEAENSLADTLICIGVSNVDQAGINADVVGEFDYLEVTGP